MGMIEQPCGMLAGLIKQPSTLIRHFFAVAFLSIWMNITETPIYLFPMALYRGCAVLWTACEVIMPYVFAELRR
jgi:squalene monooxygenase